MRKLILFFWISIMSILIIGCESDSKANEDQDKKEDKIMEYLEQITYRYIEALDQEIGSFEQRSTLQAAIGRADSVYEEIKENIKDEDLVELFADIRTDVKLGAEEGLKGNDVYLEIYFEMIEETIQKVSNEYLNGELPPTYKEYKN